MSKLTMLIGLPASGKSYISKEMERDGAVVVSSDLIRSDLYPGWREDYTIVDNNVVFEKVNNHIKNLLFSGTDVIYDATNLKSSIRRSFCHFIKNTGCECSAVVMATPLEICQASNLKRTYSVPTGYLRRVYTTFQFPLYSEGFDNISIEVRDDLMSSDLPNFSAEMFKKGGLVEYDQHNKNHTMTLGNHLIATHNYVAQHFPDADKCVRFAGLFHDIGKPQVCAFTDVHGNPTTDAHYYNHQYTSAYETMLYLMNPDNRVLGYCGETYDETMSNIVHICQLVSCHMMPYFWKQKSTELKYKNFWGEDFYNEVMMLHEADTKSHNDKVDTITVSKK